MPPALLLAVVAVTAALADDPGAGVAEARAEPGRELADTLVLEGVVFESGSAELAPESLDHLDRAAELLLAGPEAAVEVGGHTDSSGPADLNRDLSRRRAETVRRYLIMRGIPAEHVIAVGYGEDYPVAENDTPEGRARNRRVELKRLDP